MSQIRSARLSVGTKSIIKGDEVENIENILGDIGEVDDNSVSTKKLSKDNGGCDSKLISKLQNMELEGSSKKFIEESHALRTSTKKKTEPGFSESSIQGAEESSYYSSNLSSKDFNNRANKKLFLTSQLFTDERMLEMRTNDEPLGKYLLKRNSH